MTQFKFLTIQTRQTLIKRARARDVYSALKYWVTVERIHPRLGLRFGPDYIARS